NIRTLIFDQNNNLWVGTFYGLNIIKSDGEIIRINYQDKALNGISQSSVRSLYSDKQGSVWVGTYFGGVNIYNKENQYFKHSFSGDRNSILKNNDHVIGVFTEHESGKLVTGTERSGI